jgi:hypothetical protein
VPSAWPWPEGLTAEASSLAGHQQLGNLIVFYDANHISIEDVDALTAAIEAAKAEAGRPSLIQLRTIIGCPAPTKRNTGKAHGVALGADEVAATKRILGFDPAEPGTGRLTRLVSGGVRSRVQSVYRTCCCPGPRRFPETGRGAAVGWHWHPPSAGDSGG